MAKGTVQVNYQKIIQEGDVDVLVAAAQKIGEEAAQSRVTSSQIRGVFASVRQIQVNWREVKGTDAAAQEGEVRAKESYRKAMLLKPQIRYAAARNRDSLSPLDDYLVAALDQIQGGDWNLRRRYFLNFVDFFEAIVAYHKASGGKN